MGLAAAEAGRVSAHSREAEAQGVSFGASPGHSPCTSLGTHRTQATPPTCHGATLSERETVRLGAVAHLRALPEVAEIRGLALTSGPHGETQHVGDQGIK